MNIHAMMMRLARALVGDEVSEEELEAMLDRMIERDMRAQAEWEAARRTYEKFVIGLAAQVIAEAKRQKGDAS